MNNNPKLMGCRKGSPVREVQSNTGLPKEDKKSQINNLTLHLKELEGRDGGGRWDWLGWGEGRWR